MSKKALLLAANPLDTGKHGNILAHAMHLAKHGGVFWGTGYGGPNISEEFRHKDVNTGYFYNVVSKSVDHWFEAAFIRALQEIQEPDLYRLFVPEWREEDFKKYPGYWILMTQILPLTKHYSYDDFKKVDNTPVIAPPQPYTLIIDPNYPTFKIKI